MRRRTLYAFAVAATAAGCLYVRDASWRARPPSAGVTYARITRDGYAGGVWTARIEVVGARRGDVR